MIPFKWAMPTKKRIVVWILYLLVTVLLGYNGAVLAIYGHLHFKYPYIQLGSIYLSYQGAVLSDVTVSRPGLSADFGTVRVDWDKHVWIYGGSVDVTLSEAKSQGASSLAAVDADNLTISVRREDGKALLNGASLHDGKVCFSTADIEYKSKSATAANGCFKGTSGGYAQSVNVPVTLPFKLPEVPETHVMQLSGVSVDMGEKLVRFESATLGPVQVDGPATLKVTDSAIYVDTPRVTIDHPWVAPHPVYLKDMALTLPMSLLREGTGKIRLRLGRATLFFDPSNYSLDGEAECNEWLDTLPHPLPTVMQTMEGHYSGRLKFEVRTKPTPLLRINNDCKYDCKQDPIASLKKPKFSYFAYDAKGELFERTSGKASTDWVGIQGLPSYVPEAFVTMEDPGFYSHRGLHVQALENSLKINLATGKFVRGGSTISMQLAKNLWLQRHKTLGRKAYEALLTVALESCESKSEILEQYMNVVEYGPNLYGIGPAARKYFQKSAANLEIEEAFYLASIMPNPKKALPPNSGGLDRIRKLMQALAKNGLISDMLVPIQVTPGEDWQTAD